MNHLLRSLTLDIAGKSRPKSFLHWKVAFFLRKFVFSTTFRCYRNDLVSSTVNVRSPCGLLWIIYWGLSHSINWEKIQQKLFFNGKFAFFFKNLCFQQLFRCNRINPLTWKVNVKRDCGYSYIRPSDLSHSRIREKTGQKIFFTGKFAFFSKSCVFNNFLGVTELTL